MSADQRSQTASRAGLVGFDLGRLTLSANDATMAGRTGSRNFLTLSGPPGLLGAGRPRLRGLVRSQLLRSSKGRLRSAFCCWERKKARRLSSPEQFQGNQRERRSRNNLWLTPGRFHEQGGTRVTAFASALIVRSGSQGPPYCCACALQALPSTSTSASHFTVMNFHL